MRQICVKQQETKARVHSPPLGPGGRLSLIDNWAPLGDGEVGPPRSSVGSYVPLGATVLKSMPLL